MVCNPECMHILSSFELGKVLYYTKFQIVYILPQQDGLVSLPTYVCSCTENKRKIYLEASAHYTQESTADTEYAMK